MPPLYDSTQNNGSETLATIKVMCAGAVEPMVRLLGPTFERETGHTLDMNFGTAGSLRARLDGGEQADLVILRRRRRSR